MPNIDVEIRDEQAARLDRFALSVHRTPREATAQLIEEGLRHVEFPAVEFGIRRVGAKPMSWALLWRSGKS